ncbi:hypothetical protein [Mucilaginibacter pedocola]|uniref:Transcriptional regulator n=1 Tax=Mucilaginibacter pedocola TaxID=1792845 RepID=A0A1S9PFU6_9SPHI|nr:hypothetical protein [Mucilaginibacter pedocola]OOQ59846.1 hypothetical protein BC343_06790 [Mucilaginibacter pedocola]
MKILQPLTTRLSKDSTLLTSHIALFYAVLASWQRNRHAAPFRVNRRELMRISKINSIATYHRCIRDLSEKQYIIYRPSYHPKLGSEVDWPM